MYVYVYMYRYNSGYSNSNSYKLKLLMICNQGTASSAWFEVLDWPGQVVIAARFSVVSLPSADLSLAYVREYPPKIWPYMVQYLHFRILKFPLNWLPWKWHFFSAGGQHLLDSRSGRSHRKRKAWAVLRGSTVATALSCWKASSFVPITRSISKLI
jgi:hypothetical protein